MKGLTTFFTPLALLLVFGLLSGSSAFWRMPCLHFNGYYRLDPIISPGKLSDHAHALHGSAGFGMNSSYEDLISAPCTSCAVTQDKSAYWVPPLMFQHTDGTIESVPVLTFLAYYFLNGNNIRAFPPGFRMISGNNTRRDFTLPMPIPAQSLWGPADMTQDALAQKAIGFNCLHYQSGDEGSLARHFMPSKSFIDANCYDGLRLEMAFPSCWNGKDIDSPDHKSHVAYSDFVINGNCPEDFPVRLPTIFFEHYYDTTVFKHVAGKFILANNDPTGYGYHGDFATGWDGNFLQQAVNTCTSLSGMIEACPLFTVDYKTPKTCKFRPPAIAAKENCAGPRSDGLCGSFGQNDAVAAPSPVPAPAPALAPAPTPKSPSPRPNIHTVIDWVTEVVAETVTEYAKRSIPTDVPIGKY